ncbi:MAG: NADP-dependent succinic semialdehyde dehydrogenase [Robiginitomaculum sp.]|nr:MAG: NADP-dependent succinic semialdehyde dehydrogenase [Robiginitomaculum sp.]
MTIQTINPSNGEILKDFTPLDTPALQRILARASDAFDGWKNVPIQEREKLTSALGTRLEEHAVNASRLMVLEMGKTLIAAHAEMEKSVNYCQYLSKHGAQYLTDTDIKTEYKRAFTRPLPLGPILLVMPWNFPFWQVIRVAVPAILAGNTVLLKHASNVPQCAEFLETLFTHAGFPPGVFQNMLMNATDVKHLIADERIKAVSLTGSEHAGASVAEHCGKHLKKTVLELGGSDPFIVMPSANIQDALDAAFTSRMRNNGQSCIAAKRIILHADIYDDFRSGFLSKLNALNIGDPLQADTDIGPLSSARALQALEAQIAGAVEDGAELTPSESAIPQRGFYTSPAILENIRPDMRIYNAEIFGPVAMFFKATSFEHAVTLANDNPFGLSSVLFSQDEAEIETAITLLEAGSTFVNRYASSDIRLPFGGVKRSGYGREMAQEGLREFTNLKTIIIAN